MNGNYTTKIRNYIIINVNSTSLSNWETHTSCPRLHKQAWC